MTDEILKNEDLIFHYTNYPVAIEEILFKKKLRFSPLKNTNDPREYKDVKFQAVGYNWDEKTDSAISKITKFINEKVRNDYKICCFCLNPTHNANTEYNSFDYGFGKLRMWSQYGDSSFGVCLAFSKTKMINQLTDKYKENFIHNSVEYVKKPTYNQGYQILDANAVEKDQLNDFATKHINKNIRDIFLRKQNDYKDEKEYRLIIHEPESEYCYINIEQCLVSVIIGDRFPLVYKELIQKLLKNFNDILCRKLEWFNGELILHEW